MGQDRGEGIQPACSWISPLLGIILGSLFGRSADLFPPASYMLSRWVANSTSADKHSPVGQKKRKGSTGYDHGSRNIR